MLAGVVQRTMYRLRADVEDKLNRLPLSYVDRQPRGDLLSRVTNDIDNLAQSLQQTLSQLLTSSLTLVGVLIMMFIDLAAAGARRARHDPAVAVHDAGSSPTRSKTRFIAQWRHTGTLNAQVEEAFTGHALVKVFGRQHDVEAALPRQERGAVRGELRRPVHLRDHPAGDDVPRQPQLRRHRRRSAACGSSSGALTHRRRPGVHPVLPPVHPAAHAAGVDGQRAAVGHRLGRAGLRAARRRRAERRRRPTPLERPEPRGPGRVRPRRRSPTTRRTR